MNRLRRIAVYPLVALGGLAALLTALPGIPSNEWWIRIWDFPRSQILAILALCLVLTPLLLPLKDWRVWISLVVLAGAAARQAYWIWPYTPFAAVEALASPSCPEDSRILLLTANVQVSNRDAGLLLATIDRVQPDLVLLVETDDWWDAQLHSLKDAYSQHIANPREEGYGMHLFSRYPLIEPQVRFLIDDYVPSIKTRLALPSGQEIAFHGVHPVPPPLADTDERDAELLLVARTVRDEQLPAIIAGDLNDVGWSRTTRLFQEISGALDPRIGRGPFPTFNADWLILRWPLDYVFFEPDFLLMHMRVLGDIGSDHFPLLIELCHAPQLASPQQDSEPSRRAVQRSKEIIEEGL